MMRVIVMGSCCFVFSMYCIGFMAGDGACEGV